MFSRYIDTFFHVLDAFLEFQEGCRGFRCILSSLNVNFCIDLSSFLKGTETVRLPTAGSGQQMILQPNIYLYLPHLKEHPDSLQPNIVLGQGRRGGTEHSHISTHKETKGDLKMFKKMWLPEILSPEIIRRRGKFTLTFERRGFLPHNITSG